MSTFYMCFYCYWFFFVADLYQNECMTYALCVRQHALLLFLHVDADHTAACFMIPDQASFVGYHAWRKTSYKYVFVSYVRTRQNAFFACHECGSAPHEFLSEYVRRPELILSLDSMEASFADMWRSVPLCAHSQSLSHALSMDDFWSLSGRCHMARDLPTPPVDPVMGPLGTLPSGMYIF
jgi:hypothetical protein